MGWEMGVYSAPVWNNQCLSGNQNTPNSAPLPQLNGRFFMISPMLPFSL